MVEQINGKRIKPTQPSHKIDQFVTSATVIMNQILILNLI